MFRRRDGHILTEMFMLIIQPVCEAARKVGDDNTRYCINNTAITPICTAEWGNNYQPVGAVSKENIF